VIRAFRKIQDRFPDLSLVIGGKNWLGKSFPPELMDNRIRLTGFIQDEHLPALMEGAELFAFPSFHEGFGLPVIEAMSCGVPVITSNVTALPEVAGDAALCVSPHSVDEIATAMERVLTDPKLALQMSQRGLARAQRFRWETACREIVDICRELVQGA
jgi:glycosyltransferase involved in cell wall biosynthesis